ncbi:phosphate ABC transporter permease subunit PstC [Pelagibius litoralis]|uniref:Phosphate transport system permease protein n=1 Tax=Pelagibius litoralis TaxID=374515 RepID=A0A967KGA5_9PROT|nr:phosphate ABC transporter permease subunit PstC [Pelagibius litoralis]NIA71970.1 phosphate ABC transporter permease subunit PstC [Pelagibius litoralis]
MNSFILIAILLTLATIGYSFGQRRARKVSGGEPSTLHSRPQYYGLYVALWCGIPSLILMAIWLIVEPQVAEWMLISNLPEDIQALPADRLSLLINDVKNLASGNIVSREIDGALQRAADGYASARQIGNAAMVVVAIAIAVIGLGFAQRHITPTLRARNLFERAVSVLMIAASTIAVLTTLGIVLSLLFEAMRFFAQVPWYEFLFGLSWSPQTALRVDQVGGSGAFGAVPLFAGTLMITLIAMCVAVPIGLFSAIYMSEYAPPRMRAIVKPLLEILAGVPTVVYGFFAALTVAPFIRRTGESIGLDVSSESALAAGMVMGIMIIPFISSLSDDVMNAVPRALRDGAFALGATKSETIKQVIFPAALPGIVGSLLLAMSRAIGETMIVVMAAGLAANLTADPLEAVTTVTVQIVTLLVGDQEFDSAKTLAAFALGLVLFAITLTLNVIALHVVRRYREKYD